MPRKRRVEKQRTKRKLDSKIWECLKDNPRFQALSARGDTFLACLAIEQDVRDKETAFWRRIREAVIAGEIEVAEGVQHTRGDAALLLSTAELALF